MEFIGRQECRVKPLRIQRRVFRDSSRELTKAEYEKLVSTAVCLGKERLALVLETICATGIRVSELSMCQVRVGKKFIQLKTLFQSCLFCPC